MKYIRLHMQQIHMIKNNLPKLVSEKISCYLTQESNLFLRKMMTRVGTSFQRCESSIPISIFEFLGENIIFENMNFKYIFHFKQLLYTSISKPHRHNFVSRLYVANISLVCKKVKMDISICCQRW